ncbi:MAG TPA: homoserine dehydrogenase, partial [Chloroflexi bacterium]|nr:homoserine dehydrogenase [Chloroflexota bacterium]
MNVGLIGLGTVGGQVAERLLTWQAQLARRAGIELCLRRVLVRDVKKRRPMPVATELLTADPQELLEDPAIQILVEVAGGDEPMHSYLERAIRSGKHVVTANKVVMAK